MYGNDAEDPFQTYLGRAQVGLSDFGGALDFQEDSLDGGEFCTPVNLASSIQYINNTLDAFGYPPALPPPSDASLASSSLNPEVPALTVDGCVQLVNMLYSVLQRHQKDVDFRSDAADRIRRLQADKDSASASGKRWEEKLYQLERELTSLTARERKVEEQMRRMKDKHDGEKEETTRQIASLQHKDSQAQHEIRKKEREYVRLQERLQHMLNERNREAKAGMDMLQTIQKEGKKRAGWKVQAGKNVEDEMYKMIITTYETKQNELIEEAEGLRNSLRDLQAELQQLLNEHQSTRRVHTQPATTPTKHPSSSPPSTPSTGIPNEEFLSGQFDLPYSLVRETVEERIRAQMQKYREIMSNKDAQTTAGKLPASPSSPSPLQKQLDGCKKIIEEQNELVQYLLKFSNSTPLPLSPSSSSPSSQQPSSTPSSAPVSAPTSVSSSSSSSQTLIASQQTQTTHTQDDAHASSPVRTLFPTQTQESHEPHPLAHVYPKTPGKFRGMEDSREELEERLFEEEKKLFEEQKRNFEAERRRVSEMALEIAKERLEIQELKQQALLAGTNHKSATQNYNNTSLSESFIHELEQVTLQNSMENYFKSIPPSPISSYKRQ